MTRPHTGLLMTKIKNSGRGLERTRVVGQPKSTLTVPPSTTRVAHPRAPRDHRAQNARLVARGDVGIWVDLDALDGRGTGRGAGTGRPYPMAAICAVLVAQTLFHLPLRQAEGLARFLVRTRGLACEVPTFSTLCRRRRELEWDPPVLRRGQVIVIDATGITVRNPGPWLRRSQGPETGRVREATRGDRSDDR